MRKSPNPNPRNPPLDGTYVAADVLSVKMATRRSIGWLDREWARLGLLVVLAALLGVDVLLSGPSRLSLVAALLVLALVVLLAVTGTLGASRALRTAQVQADSREHLLSAMFTAANVGMALVNEDRRWVAVNPALCRMLGYFQEELEGRPIDDFTYPDDIEVGRREFTRIQRGERDTAEFEKRYVAHDGDVIWAWVSVAALKDVRGGQRYQVAQIRDITHRKRVEEQLAAERRLLNAFLRRTPYYVSFRDRDGRFLRMSDALAEALGFGNADEAIGKTDFDVFPAELAQTLFDEEQAIMAGGRPAVEREELISRPGGREVWLSTSVVPLRDDRDGSVVGTVTISIDITTRRLADERLRESEERWRTLLAQVEEMVVVIDTQGRIAYASPAVERWLGYDVDAVVGRDVTFATHPDHVDALRAALRDVRPGHPVALTRSVRAADDSWRWCESRVVRLDENDDAPLLLISQDVTERIELDRERDQLEMERRVSQRLEAVGQLAAGIAHEINTPLQFVGDSVTFLRDAVDDLLILTGLYRESLFHEADVPAHERQRAMAEAEEEADVEYLIESIPRAFTRTEDGIERVRTIVQAMKRFSHASATEVAKADINDALQTTLAVCRNEYKYVAEVRTDFGELPLVTCNIGEVNQLFLNLVLNAAQAIAEKVADSGELGRLSVRTRVDGGDVVVTIEDDGPGIPPEIRERIYEPFFTTKEVGKGTGQGLALARTTIERHRGSLTCDTEVGRGTTFTVRLPVRPPSDADADTARRQ
jgi:two-component system NtrC family sensor kinase